MAAIQQQALSGQLPVVYVSKIEKHRKKGLDIFQAIEKADEEIREEQAAAAPPPGEGQVIPRRWLLVWLLALRGWLHSRLRLLTSSLLRLRGNSWML